MTNYYRHERTDIQPLLPQKASRVLDVGAGAGATLRWIKSIYPEAKTVGVELNPALQGELARSADLAIIGKIEDRLSELQSYDLILLLDVLEHLVDPVGTLKRLSGLLSPGGHVIVSVPNIAHLSVSLPLLLGRQFTYTDAGILDRTHLKFFVEKTAIELLNSANLTATKGVVSGLDGPRSRLLNRASFGLLLHHLTKQYIMLGELKENSPTQQKICWMAVE
jgi:2-polyprenyl-3-methyl-5-hydroxy-6-metoxy-1,4-benzoquinol methylase